MKRTMDITRPRFRLSSKFQENNKDRRTTMNRRSAALLKRPTKSLRSAASILFLYNSNSKKSSISRMMSGGRDRHCSLKSANFLGSDSSSCCNDDDSSPKNFGNLPQFWSVATADDEPSLLFRRGRVLCGAAEYTAAAPTSSSRSLGLY